MTIFSDGRDILAVIDTMIFVPAIAGAPDEASFYSMAIKKCWKFVFSTEISEQYQSIMRLYGYPGAAVQMELGKLYSMNKYRESKHDPALVPSHIAPRKDRHIVAPCLEGIANVLVTEDGGILEKAPAILAATGAVTLNLAAASAKLKTMRDCLSAAY